MATNDGRTGWTDNCSSPIRRGRTWNATSPTSSSTPSAVLRTQGRLRSLLAANSHIVEHLDLADTLRSVVESAVELLAAGSGVLTVADAVGGAERSVRIGTPASGHLQPRDVHHLTVPIRVRDVVYGTMQLERPAGADFTAEDEELAGALATTAGVAIDNAKLFEHVQLREQWTTTTAEVTAALLADEDVADVLTMLVDRVRAFVDSALVCIVEPTEQHGVVQVTASSGTETGRGRGRTGAEGTGTRRPARSRAER